MTGQSDDFECGREAFRNGDYRAALRYLEPLADKGDPRAQSILGAMYAEGRGVRRDIDKARSLLEQAASAHADSEAEYYLAKTYDLSLGSTLDFAKAAGFYRRSAEKGHPGSQARLASMHLFGHGVPQDRTQACMWASLVAATGYPSALELLDSVRTVATPVQTGEGVRLAIEWLAAHPNAVEDPASRKH
jgi:TPR repeat protein